MERIEITREQAIAQIENDRKIKDKLAASLFAKSEDIWFYIERIAQTENIIKNGHGIFSLFKNKRVEVVVK